MTTDSVLFMFTDEHTLLAPRNCGLIAAPEFVRSVEDWCERHPYASGSAGLLTVDLSRVTSFESSMFRCLVWGRRRVREVGSDLVLSLPAGPVFEPREEAVIRQLFDVVEDEPQEPAPNRESDEMIGSFLGGTRMDLHHPGHGKESATIFEESLADSGAKRSQEPAIE